MDWKKLFAPQILGRGYDYYLKGRVNNLEISDDQISSTVIGENVYKVNIYLDNNKIKDMECNCPYAKRGYNCKHMAAVLFHYSKGPMKEDNYNDIRKYLDEVDDHTIKDYLAQILLNDSRLQNNFYILTGYYEKHISIKPYIERFNEVFEHYSSYDDQIQDYYMPEFVEETEFAVDDAFKLIEYKHYDEAFSFIKYIYEKIYAIIFRDDTDFFIYDELLEYLEKIIEVADEDLKDSIFTWAIQELDDARDEAEDFLCDIVFNNFYEDEYLYRKAEFLKQKVATFPPALNRFHSDFLYYLKWTITYIHILEECHVSIDEIEKFCRTYWDIKKIRDEFLHYCKELKAYDHLLPLLDECMNLEKDDKLSLIEYSDMKKEIFLSQSNKEAYKKELYDLITKYTAGDIRYYKELKNQYSPEEWIDIREDIFLDLHDYSGIAHLYAEEKLYERLIKVIKDSEDFSLINEYASILQKNYHDEVMNIYEDTLNRMAYLVRGRDRYVELIEQLDRLKTLDHSEDTVMRIIASWKQMYKNRKAMMEELNKFSMR